MRRLVLPLLTALMLTACAHDYYGGGYDDYAYAGDDWGGMGNLDVLDPWLEETEEGRVIVQRWIGGGAWERDSVRGLNIRFRHFADTDRDLRLTDEEIRIALVRCAGHGWSW
jgi:hypothetical protein